ncbi:MAG: hemerythrin family protein [Alphaproteobacteria bacterium]|nr:hemerythrin family protein [Alphaproteobacteria bacterium]
MAAKIEKWRDQISLDYPPLDDEHKAFLEVINKAVKDYYHRNLDNMPALFDACYDYVRNHFSHEEDVMERINCPDIMAHIQAHQQFIKNISEFRQAYEAAETRGKKLDLAQEVVGFLSVWFIGHLLSRDKLIKPYLVRLRNLPPRMDY